MPHNRNFNFAASRSPTWPNIIEMITSQRSVRVCPNQARKDSRIQAGKFTILFGELSGFFVPLYTMVFISSRSTVIRAAGPTHIPWASR